MPYRPAKHYHDNSPLAILLSLHGVTQLIALMLACTAGGDGIAPAIQGCFCSVAGFLLSYVLARHALCSASEGTAQGPR